MDGILRYIQNYLAWTFSQFRWNNLIDIALVTAVFYAVLYAIRGTQAVQLLRGVIVVTLIIVLITTGLLSGHTAFGWLLSRALPALLIAIPVIFQPELRRALERLGRAGLVHRSTSEESVTPVISSISRAVRELADRRHGALIVVEQETSLQNIAETGIEMDALISGDLLVTIFHPKTPLHDGAVIVRGDRVVAATAVLPLPENPPADRRTGTRHLAAIGVTEVSDAIAVVVSEETGVVSVARRGHMVRNLDEGRLSRLLHRWFARASHESRFTGFLEPFRRRVSAEGNDASKDKSPDGMPVDGRAVIAKTE
ncbi:MAG: diadenylate cyclase CdaA [Anaerolineae bacterium]